MIKSTLKIARYRPLVIQGFSNFFRIVSSDYGKPHGGSGESFCQEATLKLETRLLEDDPFRF